MRLGPWSAAALLTALVPLTAGAEEAAPPPASAGPADTEDVGVVTRKESDPHAFPDPRRFARGFYAEGGLGASFPVGPAAKVLTPAAAFSVRAGYEIRRFIAVALHATGQVGYYDDGILTRELFQQYTYTAEVRLGIPFRRYVIGVHGGAGLYHLNNNLLQLADIASSNRLFGLAWDGGLFFDVHSLSRHFSGGFMATAIGTPALQNSTSIVGQVYLRYTL